MANRETAMWLAGVGLVVLGVSMFALPILANPFGTDTELAGRILPPENIRNTVFMACMLIGGPLSIIGLIRGGVRLE